MMEGCGGVVVMNRLIPFHKANKKLKNELMTWLLHSKSGKLHLTFSQKCKLDRHNLFTCIASRNTCFCSVTVTCVDPKLIKM